MDKSNNTDHFLILLLLLLEFRLVESTLLYPIPLPWIQAAANLAGPTPPDQVKNKSRFCFKHAQLTRERANLERHHAPSREASKQLSKSGGTELEQSPEWSITCASPHVTTAILTRCDWGQPSGSPGWTCTRQCRRSSFLHLHKGARS